MKTVVLISLLTAAAESRLEFDYSVVYDMFDFKGNAEYSIKNVCEPGCRVYLTYPDDTQHNKDNGPITLVLDADHNITFHDLNRLKRDNKEKGYYEIPNGTAQFSIVNPDLVAGPLALWVLPNSAPFIDAVEVYDVVAKATYKTSASRIVLMSVAAFTASVSFVGDYSMTVKTSPFDMLSSPECEHVIKMNSTIGQYITMKEFNSPIVSLSFEGDSDRSARISTYEFFEASGSLGLSGGYVASPGYIGCADKKKVFRSESYISGISSYNEYFVISGKEWYHVSLYGDLNTDASAPIILHDYYSGGEEPMRITGTQADKTNVWRYDMDTAGFTVYWDSTLGWHNESFMIRYETVGSPLPPNTKKPTTVPSTTTSSQHMTTSTCVRTAMMTAVLSLVFALTF